MYDQQLWYWPERHAIAVLTLYLDGSYKILSEDLTEQECVDLLTECLQQAMDVDDYLDIKGLILVDHLPLDI